MATTNFTTGTVITADWLNDADAHVYDEAGAKHTADKITVTPAGNITGTDVQAALEELDTNKAGYNATLASIAALGTAADKYLYTTAANTWAEGSITAAGRALLDDANAAAQRATLDLEPGTDVLAYVAPGTSGNILVSNGSNWISSPPGAIGGVPVGTVIYIADDAAPTGYLKANGSVISRTTYSDLFAVIGTTFGIGNGTTTFGIPDLRGEFIRGWADGRAVDTGRVFGSAQAEMVGPHTHSMNFVGVSNAGAAWPNASYWDGVVGATGANSGTETRPRNIALLACIKY